MKRNKIILALALGIAALSAIGCAQGSTAVTDTGGGGSGSAPPAASAACETTFTQSTLNMQKLCVPAAGTGKHFRLEGARLQAASTALYLYLGGYDSNLDTGATAPATDSGKMRVLFYQGNAAPTLQYGNTTSVATTTAFNGYNTAASTICLDVTTASPGRVTVWATGVAGADCADKATLTTATAILDKSDWIVTAGLSAGTNYVRTSDTTNALLTKVVVSSELALAASACESNPTSGFSEICKPSAGTARHYRLEGVQTSVAHSAASIFLGVSSQPASGNATTASGQAKLQFYHGNGAAPAPQSDVDFSAQSVTVAPTYTAFTASAQTVCFDVSNTAPPRVTLWATGTNTADCTNRATLTAANAIFNKADWTTAVNLTAAKVYYYRGTSVTTTKVTAYSTIFGTGF